MGGYAERMELMDWVSGLSFVALIVITPFLVRSQSGLRVKLREWGVTRVIVNTIEPVFLLVDWIIKLCGRVGVFIGSILAPVIIFVFTATTYLIGAAGLLFFALAAILIVIKIIKFAWYF